MFALHEKKIIICELSKMNLTDVSNFLHFISFSFKKNQPNWERLDYVLFSFI